jgi:Winged helix DNA-binding domain
VRLTESQVRARRLRQQLLEEPGDARPADVAATLCGVHAQVMSAAELSIGLRLARATRSDVRHALWTERSLVKAFGPRGTVHRCPAETWPAGRPRWRQALPVAGLRGVVCFGPNRGRKVTYTNPGVPPADVEVAVNDLVRGYVRAYGPVTPANLAQWLSAPLSWARERFGALGSQLVPVAGPPSAPGATSRYC